MAAILLFLIILTVSGKNCFIFASISNCTYNFEFQNVNDDVTCHKYAETKAQGLRQHTITGRTTWEAEAETKFRR